MTPLKEMWLLFYVPKCSDILSVIISIYCSVYCSERKRSNLIVLVAHTDDPTGIKLFCD